ncbi:hypothetical protein C0995_008785 [Termitomyces sp. Mi166|nr:hypothetical protein C0995_008785 [Termitomyces sp. Mi166\
MASQTKTPYGLCGLPNKADLVREFLNMPTDTLRTPAIIVDRALFAENCADMHARSQAWGAKFRAHLKTHKTVEGTRLQLRSTVDTTQAVVVSTLMEAWQLVKAGLVADSTVKDASSYIDICSIVLQILYGLPIAMNKIADLSDLWDEISKDGGTLRILIDHPDQVKFIEKFEHARCSSRRWSVFVKIDGGQRRAGVMTGTRQFEELLSTLFSSLAISVYGFYGHAGNSYASKSSSDASSFLSAEVEAVNTAAKAGLAALSLTLDSAVHQQPFVLSVGSTPTAHAASFETRDLLSTSLYGILELHAGQVLKQILRNYPMLDLQQQYTGLINEEKIAQRVRATVVSYYSGRGEGSGDEALIDAGAIAFSKDTGPLGGYGNVIGKNWRVERISQEHGILTKIPGSPKEETLEVGSQVEIIGQHACLIAAGYPWFYVVDKNIEHVLLNPLARTLPDLEVQKYTARGVCQPGAKRVFLSSCMNEDTEGTELLETYVSAISELHNLRLPFQGKLEQGNPVFCIISRIIHVSTANGPETNCKLRAECCQLWDTAGQERFRSVTRSYYRGAAGAILVYDITNRDSFVNLSRWLADARALGSPHLVAVLVGNKSDREEDREVEWEEASKWAAENTDVHFLEASSLTGDNIEAPFLLAARSILLSIESGVLDPEKAGSGSLFNPDSVIG